MSYNPIITVVRMLGGEGREEKCVLRQNLTDSNGKGGNGDSSILDARMRYSEQSQQTCLFPDK